MSSPLVMTPSQQQTLRAWFDEVERAEQEVQAAQARLALLRRALSDLTNVVAETLGLPSAEQYAFDLTTGTVRPREDR